MARTVVDVKNSELVGKTSSPRDFRPDPDDLDTVLVSSDAIEMAREEAESVTSETATVDRYPIILDDSEEDTDRFVGNDAASSGLIAKNPDPEPETSTDVTLPKHLRAMLEEDHEVVELSESGLEMEIEAPPAKQEPRATITEVREVLERKARANDETMPTPKTDLVGLLETMPLHAALVQNVLAQVDARAAARAAGKPIPAFQQPAAPVVMPQAHPTPRQYAQGATTMGGPAQPAPRKLGTEILITLLAFLFVAVPALYYLWVSFTR